MSGWDTWRAFVARKHQKDNAKTVTAMTCGNKTCYDGQPHDHKSFVTWKDVDGCSGGSTACSRCGSTSLDRNALELP